MKKLLKYVPICAAVLALVAFILLTACNIVEVNGHGIKATDAIFPENGDPVYAALFGWIAGLLGFLAAATVAVLGLLGKGPEKVLKIVGFVACGLLVFSGIIVMFSEADMINQVPEVIRKQTDEATKLTFGYVFAGILNILAGAGLIVPHFLKK